MHDAKHAGQHRAGDDAEQHHDVGDEAASRMMVPVTTGGNSGSSRLMKGAARMPKIPAAITEP
jgi:hypothetical protein